MARDERMGLMLSRPLSRTRKVLLALTACAALVATLGLAAPGVVRLKDGSTLEGDIRQENMMVIVKLRSGVEVRIRQEMVESIQYPEDPELEFNRRHRDLDRNEVAGRVELARFCLNHRRPDLARTVLIEALELDPNNQEASDLYAAARAQIELERRAREREEASPPADRDSPQTPRRPPVSSQPTTTPEGGAGIRPPQRPVLSMDQINMVRQAEIREGDLSAQFKFENDVEKRYAAARNINLNTFRQLTPVTRFFDIRRHGDLEMSRDVKILRDPVALSEYRRLQGRIIAGCATSGCHGGGNGGSFFMLSPAENDAATYTNFYLIAKSSFNVPRAEGETVQLRMLDRTSPELSLLLQYALDPKVARYPHPPSQGYRPIFRSQSDPGYASLYNWIATSLTPIEPDYGFQFGPRSAHTPPPLPPPATTQPDSVAEPEPSTQPQATQPTPHPAP